MQTITIAGRIGRDAETRNAGDTTVTSFTVAVDQRIGREEKTTNWWRVSMWGTRGQNVARFLTKGSSVAVSGDFSLTDYEGKPQLNIRAHEIALQGGRSEEPRREPDGSRGAPLAQSSAADDLDDDVPFATRDTAW